jgi:hypothetical protein
MGASTKRKNNSVPNIDFMFPAPLGIPTRRRILTDGNARLKRWILMTMNRRLSTESRRFPPKHHALLAGKAFPLHI